MPIDNTIRAQLKKPEQPQQNTQQGMGGVDPRQEIEQFLEQIAAYNEIGGVLRRESLKEAGERLASIAEMAEIAVTNEASDWYDAHTLKRHMKEVKSYAGDFVKLAQEADGINQRMAALYDDMGRILERYFELPKNDASSVSSDVSNRGNETEFSDVSSELGADNLESDSGPQKLKEVEEDDPTFSATPIPPVTPDPKKMDELTLRAIQAVFKRLKKKDSTAAKRFKDLPPAKMKEIVWQLVTRV